MSTEFMPKAVATTLKTIGEDLTTWRKLRQLTARQVADRAGISISTVLRLESGKSSSLESLIRVARALGIHEELKIALDPYSTDIGRLRADEALPRRVRN